MIQTARLALKGARHWLGMKVCGKALQAVQYATLFSPSSSLRDTLHELEATLYFKAKWEQDQCLRTAMILDSEEVPDIDFDNRQGL